VQNTIISEKMAFFKKTALKPFLRKMAFFLNGGVENRAL